ncbi:hypothetical protein C4D60_Mb07t13080 [Musa balbisiana]|uniref:Uncharacterized protein n=1 Tax=Musa balbisiana TaxID=52838 RepID=A0A4S8JG55_MUSBA|nr:hypothetical protein C4D60_Mb07t13080 [Musa balbisiana]
MSGWRVDEDEEYVRDVGARTTVTATRLTTAVEREIELAVVIPVLVLGPLLQPTLNASAMHVMKYLDWSNAVQGYANVLDVAEAHASSPGSSRSIRVDGGWRRCRCSNELNPRKQPYKFSNQRLKELGVGFMPVSRSLFDTVKSRASERRVISLIASTAGLLRLGLDLKEAQ